MNNKDDDNRVIADMSNIDRRGIAGTWFGIFNSDVRRDHGPGRNLYGGSNDASHSSGGFDSKNMGGSHSELSPEDRRALIFYTLKYALGIGAIFLVSFGVVIALLLKLWN